MENKFWDRFDSLHLQEVIEAKKREEYVKKYVSYFDGGQNFISTSSARNKAFIQNRNIRILEEGTTLFGCEIGGTSFMDLKDNSISGIFTNCETNGRQ